MNDKLERRHLSTEASMEITRELLQKILDLNDFTWIPVKRYQYEPGDGAGPFQQDFWRLYKHHCDEAEFMLKLVRALAQFSLDRIDAPLKINWSPPSRREPKCRCEKPTIENGKGCSACLSCSVCKTFMGCFNGIYDQYSWPLATLKDGTVINKDLNDRLRKDGIV